MTESLGRLSVLGLALAGKTNRRGTRPWLARRQCGHLPSELACHPHPPASERSRIASGAQDSATPLASPDKCANDALAVVSAHTRSRLIHHDQWRGAYQSACKCDQALLARGQRPGQSVFQAESATMAKVSRASASAESIGSPRTARASMIFSSTFRPDEQGLRWQISNVAANIGQRRRLRPTMLCSAIQTEPESGARAPAATASRELLPEPVSPCTTTNSPKDTPSVTSWRAGLPARR